MNDQTLMIVAGITGLLLLRKPKAATLSRASANRQVKASSSKVAEGSVSFSERRLPSPIVGQNPDISQEQAIYYGANQPFIDQQAKDEAYSITAPDGSLNDVGSWSHEEPDAPDDLALYL